MSNEDLRIEKPNLELAILLMRAVYAHLRVICEDMDTVEKSKRADEALQYVDNALFSMGVSQLEINQLHADTVPPGEAKIGELLRKHSPTKPDPGQAQGEHETGV